MENTGHEIEVITYEKSTKMSFLIDFQRRWKSNGMEEKLGGTEKIQVQDV